MFKNFTISASAIGAGGIPDDLQTGLIQVAVGLVAWLLTKVLDRIGKKNG